MLKNLLFCITIEVNVNQVFNWKGFIIGTSLAAIILLIGKLVIK